MLGTHKEKTLCKKLGPLADTQKSTLTSLKITKFSIEDPKGTLFKSREGASAMSTWSVSTWSGFEKCKFMKIVLKSVTHYMFFSMGFRVFRFSGYFFIAYLGCKKNSATLNP